LFWEGRIPRFQTGKFTVWGIFFKFQIENVLVPLRPLKTEIVLPAELAGSVFVAAASEWMRCENGSGRRSDHEAKIPVEDLPSQEKNQY